MSEAHPLLYGPRAPRMTRARAGDAAAAEFAAAASKIRALHAENPKRSFGRLLEQALHGERVRLMPGWGEPHLVLAGGRGWWLINASEGEEWGQAWLLDRKLVVDRLIPDWDEGPASAGRLLEQELGRLQAELARRGPAEPQLAFISFESYSAGQMLHLWREYWPPAGLNWTGAPAEGKLYGYRAADDQSPGRLLVRLVLVGPASARLELPLRPPAQTASIWLPS